MADDGFDFGSLLKFGLPLLWFLGSWLKQQAAKRGGAPRPQRTAEPPPRAATGGLAPRADAREATTNAQANTARALQSELAAVGGRADALMSRVLALGPRGESLAEVLAAGPAALAARVAEAAQDPKLIAQHRAALQAASAHLAVVFDVLEAQIASRNDRFLAERITDAEAIFDDMWAPLADHARDHGLELPPTRPLAFPTPGEGGEAVITGLLPPGHPLIFVPADFGDRLLRWPSLAHELGHLLHDRLPGLADELADHTGWRGPGPTPGAGQASLESVRACLGAWRVELFCDVVATLLLGPAALAGFAAAFQRSDEPAAVLTALADGPRLRPHPPAHLRVLVSQAVLESLDHGQTAAQLVKAWRAMHRLEAASENAENTDGVAFLIPRTDGKLIRVRESLLLGLVLPGLNRLLDEGLDSLAGHRFIDVPGLVMNRSTWGLVQRAVTPLTKGEAVYQRPRLVLCAAILAASSAPRANATLTTNLHRCILGRASDARRPSGSIGASDRSKPASPRAALRDAMRLREALNGPRGGLLPAALRVGGRRAGHHPPTAFGGRSPAPAAPASAQGVEPDPVVP